MSVGYTALSAAIGLILAGHGYRKKSLTKAGAYAAFFVGFVSFLSSVRNGLLLISFYQSSSSLTKFKAGTKAKINEAEDDSNGRGAAQVLACSLLATCLCVASLWQWGINKESVVCASSSPWLAAAYIAHYACTTGDTWASELGVLDPFGDPILSTSLRKVPRGTNGAMSVTGTLASLLGGAFIGLVAFVSGPAGDGWLALVLLGAAAGLGGSLIDSLLGATLQETRYDDNKKRIVHAGGRVVCGSNVLSNVQVNLVSVFITMALAAFLGPSLLCSV